MITKNPMQLKAFIKKKASEKIYILFSDAFSIKLRIKKFEQLLLLFSILLQ